MESVGRDTLHLNLLKNTTYKPIGPTPEDFAPAVSFDEMREYHGRKIDYRDDEYIVTTLPQAQKEEIDRDGDTECMCTGWFKRTVVSAPGFPSPIVHPKKVVYEVREADGRGLGVFALEDIQIGDLIVAERPLIVNLIRTGGRPRPDLSQEEVMRRIFGSLERNLEQLSARMSPKTLKTYMALCNSHRTDGSGPLTEIMRTNGFSVGLYEPSDPETGAYSCTGAVAARFNHSCSPNAVHTFHLPSFAMEIHALQPIAKGEEIVVSYTSIEATAEARQIALKPYGFVCTCSACQDPATSDMERAKAVSSLLPKTSQGVQHAEAVLAAYEATGLHSLSRYTDLLSRVAKINRKKGKVERAAELESLADTITGLQSRSFEGKGLGGVGMQFMPLDSPEDALSALKVVMQYAGSEGEREDMMNMFKQAMNLGSRT